MLAGDYWLIDGSGSVLHRLTDIPDVRDLSPGATWAPDVYRAAATGATWSPDGSRIALSILRPDRAASDIELVDLGTTTRTLLAEKAEAPAWRPTGTEIGFRSGPSATEMPIAAVGVDGTWRRSIVPHARSFAWSPDGSRLAFTTATGTPRGIVVVRADGTGVTAVAPGETDATGLAWSPDGTRILFNGSGGSGSDGGARVEGLWMAHSDGSPTTLVAAGGRDGAWSPDGDQILYVDADGLEIARVGPAGIASTPSQPAQTIGPGLCGVTDPSLPAWSPDGAWISFLTPRTDWFVHDLNACRPDGAYFRTIVTGVQHYWWAP